MIVYVNAYRELYTYGCTFSFIMTTVVRSALIQHAL